jgi:hypothetical protein
MNIIELAQECQLIGMRPHLDGIYQEALEKFAALVATAARADERERIAKWYETEGHMTFPVAIPDVIRGMV